jgi:predicted nucleotidyltransferase
LTSTRDDPTLRDLVEPVVAELIDRAPAAAGHLMLVGALCRDVLHREAGQSFALRRTSDLDLALAVDSQERFEEVGRLLPRAQSSAQVRYELAGVKVDLVPFGGVESPAGAVPLTPGIEPLDVFAFGDVWDAARVIRLNGGPELRIPTVPGYTVLKLGAWATRSRYGEFKDGGDLACAMYWYQNSPAVHDRLYENDRGHHILGHAWAHDPPLDAHTLMLADDAVGLLTTPNRIELINRWAQVEDDLLTTYLDNGNLEGWPTRGSSILAGHVRSLREGLHLPTPPPEPGEVEGVQES